MLSFFDVIPARSSIRPGDSLNILGGAVNPGPVLEMDLTVWGNAGNGWIPLVSKPLRIEAGEHKHLYFTLTPEILYARLWANGPEEFDLLIRDTMPGPEETGVLIFLSP